MAYLRLVLGVPAETPITLSGDLEAIVNDPAEAALAEAKLDLNGHVDYQLANTLIRLQELDVQNQKTAGERGFFIPVVKGSASAVKPESAQPPVNSPSTANLSARLLRMSIAP